MTNLLLALNTFFKYALRSRVFELILEVKNKYNYFVFKNSYAIWRNAKKTLNLE